MSRSATCFRDALVQRALAHRRRRLRAAAGETRHRPGGGRGLPPRPPGHRRPWLRLNSTAARRRTGCRAGPGGACCEGQRAAGAARAVPRHSPATAQDQFPQREIRFINAFAAGRHIGPARAHPRRPALATARPTRGGGQPHRRRGHHRHGGGGARRAGRAHDPARLHGHHDHHAADPAAALRRRPRPHAARQRRLRLQHPRRQPERPGPHLAGPGAHRQGEAGQPELRDRGRRVEPAALLRAVLVAHRRAAGAGALSRRRPGDPRHHRRAGST